MDLSPAIQLIEHWEGCVLHAYQDAVGVWTIGYGTTTHVTPGQICTREQALAWLNRDAEDCAEKIKTFANCATNNQLCALVSLAYNVGVSALQHSHVISCLNEGNVRAAADHFMDWVHAGGRVLPGLVARRREERLLFLA